MDTSVAQSLNPHAGWHPISVRPGHLEAARRAADASVTAYPYYLERFGERGRMFGASDGAWLLTLCDGGPEHVREQLLWLGNVLSTRGMPRWLLERHLHFLHEALVKETSDTDGCRWLLDGAEILATRRRSHLPDAAFEEIAAAFADGADAELVRRLPGMGEILVSSAADEADGLAQAGRAVEEWAADPARFPSSWTRAVRATMAEARTRIARAS